MPSLSSILASITAYTNLDIETLVTLFVVFSLIIGLLVNLPSISFLSKKNSAKNENMLNSLSKNFSNLKSSFIQDERKQSEDRSQKRKVHHKREGDDSSSISQHRKSQVTRMDMSNPQQKKTTSNSNSTKSNTLSTVLRCVFVVYLPILICSAIPSFYPIYKSYIAPYLPDYLQHFFTDIKNLFLTIFNLFVSGAIFDGSYESNDLSELFGNRSSSSHQLLHSMQDWIYSYIRHCDLSIQYSILSFCLSCTSPTPLQYYIDFGSASVCTPCDYCFIEIPFQPSLSNFSKSSCKYLMSDFSRLVHSQHPLHEQSFLFVMKDCFNTFLLYNRFFIHLFSRLFLHVLQSLSSLLLQVTQYYIWFGKKTVQTYSTNKTRSIALFFILILLLSLTIWMVRIFVRVILFFGRSFVHTFGKTTVVPSEEKSSSSTSGEESVYSSSQVEHSHHSSSMKHPSWFTAEIESTFLRNGIKLEDQWNFIMKESPAIAELILDCNYNNEEIDWLMKLLEQLCSEKEISEDVMDCVRTVISSRPVYSPLKGYSSRAATANPYSPIPEVASPTVFSPVQNVDGNRLTRNPNGLGRVVRPHFFRLPNSLKGKGIRTRNSVSSDGTSWSVKNENDLMNDLL